MSPEDKFVRVYKFVLAGLLIGWFIKLPAFFWKYFNVVIFDYPIHYEFFPTMFDAPFTARMFYLLPILTVVGFTLKFEKWHLTVYKVIAGIFLISSIVMMLHLASYNDATFVTSFWVSLWLLWFCFHRGDDEHKHAINLALILVSVTFLGGFIGKCTGDWWNGEAFFGIMQSFFTHYPFEWIKNNFTFEQLSLISKYMSWCIIFIEFALATSFLWPRKHTLRFVPLIILGIVFFRTWKILSVVSSLAALLWACLYLLPEKTEELEEETV